MATSKPEVLITQSVSQIETRFRRLRLGFRGPQTSGTSADTEMCTRGTEFSMATSKPEVLATQAISKIETRFRWLDIGLRGRPVEWNIERYRNKHARYRISQGHVKPGSSYK
jgi:hypothetical protein